MKGWRMPIGECRRYAPLGLLWVILTRYGGRAIGPAPSCHRVWCPGGPNRLPQRRASLMGSSGKDGAGALVVAGAGFDPAISEL